MADEHKFLALDLGAESGRGEVVCLRDGKVSMEEIHRFPTRNVLMGETRHWDFPAIYADVLAALSACAARGDELDAISVDTWGVDFGLIGPDGMLLANPVHYRDARTDGIHEHATKVMPIEDIFMETALHTMPINTLFQLHAMQRSGSPLLEAADAFLMMPDLIAYFLTGVKACETSDAQTSQLLDTSLGWSEKIIGRFGLPKDIFGDLIEPASVIGPVAGSAADATGLGGVPMVACASHDTSAAVAAVPAEGDNWAFISCGTWSILGRPVEKPVATKRCYELGFTNEYTYGGWYLARNILGLWLVQELRRNWDTPEDPWDYPRMTAAAEKARSGPLVDVSDPRLLAPADMEAALLEVLAESGQATPADRGELVRIVLESLALEYNWCVGALGELSGRQPDAVNIVGGGIKNTLLCQLTADATGLPVHAGADQCTALGNALGQALAMGVLKSPTEIRDVMRASTEMTTYEPRDADAWAEKRERYRKLQGSKTW